MPVTEKTLFWVWFKPVTSVLSLIWGKDFSVTESNIAYGFSDTCVVTVSENRGPEWKYGTADITNRFADLKNLLM